MTPRPHSGQGEGRAELGLQSVEPQVPGAEQSRNQLQSKVQQLEELPEAPELYGASRAPLRGDVSSLCCTSHFLGQDFTGNSEE